MKRMILTSVFVLLAVSHIARADDWDNALRGGLVGAALGAIVGHNSNLTTEFSVPAFAGLGALAGYGYDNGWYGYDHDRYGYGTPYRYRWHDDYPYAYHPRHHSRHHQEKPPKARKLTPAELAPSRDLTPGVQLVTVPLSLPSGLAVNLRLIKLPDRYVGPQGETYAELPSTAALAERYLPKP